MPVLKQLVVPTAVFTQRHQYDKAAWESHNDSIAISSLPIGVYLIEVSTPDKEVPVSRSLLRVSNLMVLQQPLPDKVTRIVVVNATTGAPVSNAKLQLTKHDHTIVTTLTTDSNGEVAYTNNSTVRYLWPSTNDDKASTETYYYTYSSMYGYLTDSDKGIANKPVSLHRPCPIPSRTSRTRGSHCLASRQKHTDIEALHR